MKTLLVIIFAFISTTAHSQFSSEEQPYDSTKYLPSNLIPYSSSFQNPTPKKKVSLEYLKKYSYESYSFSKYLINPYFYTPSEAHKEFPLNQYHLKTQRVEVIKPKKE